MFYGLETGFTILLSIIGFIIVIYAQFKVNGAYGKYKKVVSKNNISGFEAARMILDKNGLNDVHIVETKGTLSDHYDPSRKVLRLSHDIFHGSSIAAISVAAHEVGHAIQDKTGYTFMKIRSFLVPVVNVVTYIGYIVSFISIFAGITGYLTVGIVMILAAILFQLVTLPVEFDASRRAKKELLNLSLVDTDDAKNVKSMLSAAAMTYVASLITSLINLLRLIIMLNDRD